MYARLIRMRATALVALVALAWTTGCASDSKKDDASDEPGDASNTETSEASDAPEPSESDESDATSDIDESDSESEGESETSDSDETSDPLDTSDVSDASDTEETEDTSNPVDTSNTSDAPDSGETSDPVDASDPSDGSEPDDTSDTTGEGVQDPEIVVEESTEYGAGLEPRDSTLNADASGELQWLFTLENTTEAPLCIDLLPVKLYDKDGNVLAGRDPGTPPSGDGPALFAADIIGSPYRNDRDLVINCIGPGERGLGRATAVSLDGQPLDVDQILADAGRIEYFFHGATVSDGYLPAPELLVLADATLTQTDQGAVITGSASNGAPLIEWTVHAALYDASGKLVDFVSKVGEPWEDSEGRTFELPAGSAEATRFELYSQVTIWQ